MTNNLTLNQAIGESAGYVSIHGQGTSWKVIGPHSVFNLGGPSTSWDCDSWAKARLSATQWRAEIALVLMGKLTRENKDDVTLEMEEHRSYGQRHTLRDFIEAGLRGAARAERN